MIFRSSMHISSDDDRHFVESLGLWNEYIQRKLPSKYLFVAIFHYKKFVNIVYMVCFNSSMLENL